MSISRRAFLGASLPAIAGVRLAAQDVDGLPVLQRSIPVRSLYTHNSSKPEDLTWDVCSATLHTMLTSRGQPRGGVTGTAVHALAYEQQKGGVTSSKELRFFLMQHWHVQIDEVPVILDEPTVEVSGGVLPKFRWRFNALALSAVYSILELPGEPDRLVVNLKLRSYRRRKVSVTWGAEDASSDLLPFANSPQALLRTHGPEQVTLKPRGCSELTLSWHQEGDTADIASTAARHGNAGFLERYGRAYRGLSVPNQPELGRAYARMAELARSSLLAAPDGSMLGGFLGSDFDERSVNWTRDAYYAALSCAITHPETCRRMIPFLMRWSVPERCSERGLKRFPQAGPITQSLSNSVSGICLAGAYIRATGDSEWFAARPEFLERCQHLLRAVENSRIQNRYMLFPSMFFSDGDARGDFHTGSNVAAWYAFQSASTIARISYGRLDLSEQWETIANMIKADLHRCCLTHDDEPRFVEGSNIDGSFVPGHDGEESETTLMPFYGFCPADDARLIRHADLAMTCANPFYAHGVDGIWWYNERWGPATFPAWLTHLVGSRNFAEVEQRLLRIAELTDLDGSVWWWPFSYGTTDRSWPKRSNGARKCSWAGGLYILLLLTKVFGIGVDALCKSVSFAPLFPWERFSWSELQYGSTYWTLFYKRGSNGLLMSLENHNSCVYSASIIAPQPYGAFRTRVRCDPKAVTIKPVHHYGQPAFSFRTLLSPGQAFEVEIEYQFLTDSR